VYRLAITARVVENQEYTETRDAISHDWVRFFETIIPDCLIAVIPTQTSDPKQWLKHYSIDGVVLSNGEDISASPDRDRLEYEIIRHCLKSRIKVFGACRGLQVINRYFGGGRPTELKKTVGVNHIATSHVVQIVDKKYRYDCLDEISVNSYHQQGVLNTDLSPDLQPFAVCEDVIEGLYHPTHSIVAVQWHPERVSDSNDYDEWLVRNYFTGK
jgi:N5-(cytidine 5'-diphosphoramidyl)-L-glutamine hydrolase